VAICEQVEDPKLAKGLAAARGVETVTPGTVWADDWLERNRNNFLLAVDARRAQRRGWGTGPDDRELLLETVAPEDLVTKPLARYEPGKSCSRPRARRLQGPGWTPRAPRSVRHGSSIRRLAPPGPGPHLPRGIVDDSASKPADGPAAGRGGRPAPLRGES